MSKILQQAIEWAIRRGMKPEHVGFHKEENGDVTIYDKRFKRLNK